MFTRCRRFLHASSARLPDSGLSPSILEPDTENVLTGTFGDEPVRQRGLALLLANKDSGAVIPSDVRGVVYRLAVQSGDPRAYEIVKAMYLQASR